MCLRIPIYKDIRIDYFNSGRHWVRHDCIALGLCLSQSLSPNLASRSTAPLEGLFVDDQGVSKLAALSRHRKAYSTPAGVD